VLRHRMAYRAAEDRRVTRYQAQYFCHCAGRRFERDEPDSDWLFELPRPLNWIATLSFWFWGAPLPGDVDGAPVLPHVTMRARTESLTHLWMRAWWVRQSVLWSSVRPCWW
jgi:hypothetical protein